MVVSNYKNLLKIVALLTIYLSSYLPACCALLWFLALMLPTPHCDDHAEALQASHCVCTVAQVSEKFAEGGDTASVSAVDMAKQVADQAVPTADRINQKIEKQAHELTANAEFHSKDVANEYQKGAKVHSPSVPLIQDATQPYIAVLRLAF